MLCIANNLIKHLLFASTQWNDQTVLFQTIPFSIGQSEWFQVLQCIANNSIKHESFVCPQFKWSNNSIWSIDMTISGATTPGQRRPGSIRVLRIFQSSRITGVSPSHCFVSYNRTLVGRVLPLCRYAVCVFSYLPHPAWAGYDTRSIFKRNLTGLNSEYSFS